jgi:hypothetical protein
VLLILVFLNHCQDMGTAVASAVALHAMRHTNCGNLTCHIADCAGWEIRKPTAPLK